MTSAAVTVSVLEVRPHPSVVRREVDADHHREQWAIRVRMSYGATHRTFWQWMDARQKPTKEDAARFAAQQLVLEQPNSTPADDRWWRGGDADDEAAQPGGV